MKVTHDKVVILQDAPKETTDSGVYIPISSQKPSNTGEVIEVGNKVLEVRPGDRVMYMKDSGVPLQVDGRTYLIMKESQILMTMHESN